MRVWSWSHASHACSGALVVGHYLYGMVVMGVNDKYLIESMERQLIVTRSRALDDQFSVINNRHDAVLSKLDTLAEVFETLQNLMASQQTVIANLMAKVAKLEKITMSPLLPLPPTLSANPPFPLSTTSKHSSSIITMNVRPPKLVPLFSGENV